MTPSPAVPRPSAAEPVVVSWSGGKDSALALARVLADPRYRVEALLTTVVRDTGRIGVHGVPRALLARQGDALGLPVVEIPIPEPCPDHEYEAALLDALAPFAARGVRHVVCGDLFLEEIRAYRERVFARVGMTGLYPLWGEDTALLARRCIGEGFRAVLVCVDGRRLPASLCGRDYDAALLQSLPCEVDPCGENGEFHTFVYDGPIFGAQVPLRCGALSGADGFVRADLLPPPAAGPGRA